MRETSDDAPSCGGHEDTRCRGIGAGVMGAQIAAHLANAGVRVLLLDVTREAARDGLARARRLKPDPFFTSAAAALIDTGGFDADLARLADADWIIEAIVEQLDAKRALMARVDTVRRADALVSSNTSGIPIASIAEGRSDGFRRSWLGTHFFNPPRYLHLLEIIPTAETDPALVFAVSAFADLRLGKGVVRAKDAPGFIANRIGIYGVMQALKAVASGEYTIEEVDAITGPAIGRPKSATFRTVDIAGVDVLAHVARTLADRLEDPAERAGFELPPLVEQMVARGMIGAKTGRGFYEKRGEEILTLDPKTLEYRPRQSPVLPSLEASKSIEPIAERIRVLYQGRDKVGAFLRDTFGPTLEYAARITPEVAYQPEDVDKAMQWGFGWEVGPLETLAALQTPNITTPISQSPNPKAQPPPSTLHSPTSNLRTVRRNAGASLIDLGDGVLQIEFHSKMNAIGGDTLEMIQAGVREASRNFAAIVIANEAVNFSAGANLMLLLLEAQEQNWDEVDLMVRAFQGATMALEVRGRAGRRGARRTGHRRRMRDRASRRARAGRGGGVYRTRRSRRRPHSRRRRNEGDAGAGHGIHGHRRGTHGYASVRAAGIRDDRLREDRDERAGRPEPRLPARRRRRDDEPRPAARRREGGGAGARARLSSAPAALRDPRRRRQRARGAEARRPPRVARRTDQRSRRADRPHAGQDSVPAAILPHPGTVTEQQLLDLEREAFLSLCGEPKTLERIAHTLKTGKPLRN